MILPVSTLLEILVVHGDGRHCKVHNAVVSTLLEILGLEAVAVKDAHLRFNPS